MRRPSRWFSLIVLMLATFVAYWPALRNSFVWDDTALVLRDPLIRHWRLLPETTREFLFLDATPSNFYRPLQRMTYTMDYALWGINRAGSENTGAPAAGDGQDLALVQQTAQPGWHFTSVLIHALAAMVLWHLLQRWLGLGWGALLGALAWALHPLHTSAVTYVSGRADPLAALFAFGALGLVARAHASGHLPVKDRAISRAVIGAMVCAFAALLSKESGIAALLLWLLWVLFKARTSRPAWLAWLAAVVVVLGAYLSLRLGADSTPVPPSQKESSLIMRPVLAARALAEYAALFVAPHSLHMERDISIHPTDDAKIIRFRHLQTAVGAVLAAGLVIWALWARRRAPEATLALACFAVTWLPISNLFKLNATVAEHWLYVPSAFLLAALVATGAAFFRHRPAPGPLALAGLWILFLSVQTWRQHGYWSDQRTFVEMTIQRAGMGPRMMVNEGNLFAAEGKTELAIERYRTALSLDPHLAIAHHGIAVTALRQQDYATALAELAEAEKSPMFIPGGLVLRSSIAQAQTGRPQLHLLAQAVNAAPRNWELCRRLPEALIALGNLEGAFDELKRQINVRPYRAETWLLTARVAERRSEFAKAAGDEAAAAKHRTSAAGAYGGAANRDLRNQESRAKLIELRPPL